MTPARLAAAAAGIVTTLLLQATVVGPALPTAGLSLPAVLVAAVAMVDGPATGLAFGFVAGLAADLGSRHPAGVLALCWLGVGLVCGAFAGRTGLLRNAVAAGLACALAGAVGSAILVLVHAGGTPSQIAAAALPTVAGDVLLALPVLALVRPMLRTRSLRAPRPVVTELAVARRG